LLFTALLDAPPTASFGLDRLRVIRTPVEQQSEMNSLSLAPQAHLPTLQLWQCDRGHEQSIFNVHPFNVDRTFG
jgi:hypothetical protein